MDVLRVVSFVCVICVACAFSTPHSNSNIIVKHSTRKISLYDQPEGVQSKSTHYLEHGVDTRGFTVETDYHREGTMKQADIEIEQLSHMSTGSENGHSLVRNKRFMGISLWTNGTIPYVFDDIDDTTKAAILSVFGLLHQYTCIRFFPKDSGIYNITSHNAYLNFINGNGCWSFIGRQSIGRQDISTCSTFGTALHEIFHAISAYHEQSHFDRDEYIQLHIENVLPSYREDNFMTVPIEYQRFIIPSKFDQQSIMLYSKFGLSKNGFSTTDPLYEDIGNERDGFLLHIKEINENYRCNDYCTDPKAVCENDGFLGFCKETCQCICPDGFDPSDNCRSLLPEYLGEVYKLDDQTPEVSFNTPGAPDSGIPSGSKYMWVFRVPEGSKLKVQITDISVAGTPEECFSTLTVKRNILAQNGTQYCGHGFEKSILSFSNKISITLEAGSSSSSYLAATATILPAENFCYNLDDKGETYDGEMNIAYDNSPCLAWSEATECDGHPFSSPNLELKADFSGNQCRNPGQVLLEPWCYTDINGGGCKIKPCDACGYGAVFDSYNDCSELISDDSDYCSSKDAAIGCRLSCGMDITITSARRCGPPPSVPGGTAEGPILSSYPVGSHVTYVCGIDSMDKKHRYCLSTGQWSALEVVCSNSLDATTVSQCSDGYTYLESSDMCYRFGETSRSYRNANTICSREGGVLATVNAADLQAFLVALRAGNGDTTAYIGARRNRGRWYWKPNFSNRLRNGYTNWLNGYPRYACGYLDTESKDSKWNGSKCSVGRGFFCQKDPVPKVGIVEQTVPAGLCGDSGDNCISILKGFPDICTAYPVFSTLCPATCGTCNPEGVTCNIPSPRANVQLNTVGSSLGPGQVVSYSCVAGTVLALGDLLRACLRDGTFTGQPPVCKAEDDVTKPLNNMALIPLSNLFYPTMLVFGPSPLTAITRFGSIEKWSARCIEPGVLKMMVMEYTGATVTIRGYNKVRCRRDRVMEWDIDEEDRISVTPGQFIGVADKTGATLTYGFCGDMENYGYLEYNFIRFDQLRKGTQLVTDSEYYVCLVAPTNAIIGPTVRD